MDQPRGRPVDDGKSDILCCRCGGDGGQASGLRANPSCESSCCFGDFVTDKDKLFKTFYQILLPIECSAEVLTIRLVMIKLSGRNQGPPGMSMIIPLVSADKKM